MQHFGSRLTSEIVPEWRDHYLEYTNLKKLVQKVEQLRFEQERPVVKLSYPAPKPATPQIQQQGASALCSQLTEALERGILKSDAKARELIAEVQIRMAAVYEANSDILEGIPLGETAAMGGGAGGGIAATLLRVSAATPGRLGGGGGGLAGSRSGTAGRPSNLRGSLVGGAHQHGATEDGCFPNSPVRAIRRASGLTGTLTAGRPNNTHSASAAVAAAYHRSLAAIAFPSTPTLGGQRGGALTMSGANLSSGQLPSPVDLNTAVPVPPPKLTADSIAENNNNTRQSTTSVVSSTSNNFDPPPALRKFALPSAVASSSSNVASPTETNNQPEVAMQRTQTATRVTINTSQNKIAPPPPRSESEMRSQYDAMSSATPQKPGALGDDDDENDDRDQPRFPTPGAGDDATQSLLYRSHSNNDNNNNDTDFHQRHAASVAESIFDAVMRKSRGGKGGGGGGTTSDEEDDGPEDVQLRLLLETHQLLVKVFRFCELNELSARRILHKYQRYVLEPFENEMVPSRTATSPSSPVTNGEGVPAAAATTASDVERQLSINNYGTSAAVTINPAASSASLPGLSNSQHPQQQQHHASITSLISSPFVRCGVRIKNMTQTSPLHDRLRQVERMIERVREVAEKLYGPEIISKYFTNSVTVIQDKRQWTIKWKFALLSFLLLFLMLAIGPSLFPSNHHAANCAALIVCVAALWVTEAIPFFAAALFIPLLAVPLNVLPVDIAPTHKEAASLILGKTFGSTQVLVLGGLCLGKALAKHKLEQVVSKYCLAPIAHRPKLFVLVLMLISTIACAFLSNVAAPLLILNVIQPTLWRMSRSQGGPQAILLCLAIAGNLGGMASPNASPQNAVALAALQEDAIGYVTWILGALPLVLVQLVVGWFLVLQIWKPFDHDPNYVIPVAGAEDDDGGGDHNNDDDDEDHNFANDELAAALLKQSSAARRSLREQLLSDRVEKAVVLATTLVTIVLWCVPTEGTFGNAGAVALFPIVVFFGLGVLSKEDFNSLSWHLLFLLAGGNMIGLVAKDSNLLTEIVEALKPFLTNNPPFAVVAVLIITVGAIACPLSHTVTALVLMPVIVQVAKATPELPSEQALVFNTVLMASGSMLFPVSSFPNIQSLLCEDAMGQPYLAAKDFILPGGVMTVLSVVQLATYYTPFSEWMFPR